MFLSKDYVFSTELVSKMGIHMANISMLRKEFEENDDLYSIRKMKSCTFVNRRAKNLPRNIRAFIEANGFTDMTRLLPRSWVVEEYLTELNVKERDLLESGIATGVVDLYGKKFLEFDPEFVRTMQGKIGYVLNEIQKNECLATNDIDGYRHITKDLYYTWYTAGPVDE